MRAAGPGRGPKLRLVYTRPPCLPRSREREEDPRPEGNALRCANNVHLVYVPIIAEGSMRYHWGGNTAHLGIANMRNCLPVYWRRQVSAKR